MKTFSEWTAEKTGADEINPVLSGNDSFFKIKEEIGRCINQSLEYLKANPDTEDRVEFNAFGFVIKAWTTKINTKTRYYLGYGPDWNKDIWIKNFRPLSSQQDVEKFIDEMANMLYLYRGNARS
jgi:hypothetical protein